ncbi:MAG: sulfite reductase, partial [Azospira oryzae]
MGEPLTPDLKLTAEEALKEASNFLRGTIAIGLDDPVTGALSEEDAKLLKFHGSYQQDDRDLRVERQRQKLEPAYLFMVRVRMPGGVCTPAQWLAMDALARSHANGTLRITTRQTFQFHGVLKRHLKPLIAGINQALLNTLAACGDVNRNVICHNNPYLTPVHEEVYRLARAISDHLLPRTRAYRELWLDEKPSADTVPDEEPLYGPTYLPRKFKIGLAVPPVNDVDVFAQDLGFIAVAEGARLVGFNVAVGGGMGMSHGDPATYPRLAEVIGFCPPEKAVQVAEEVVKV